MRIERVHARQILDSRGNPTVETDVMLENGIMGRAAVPSGVSTGQNEALELRDGDTQIYNGKSVQRAVEHVNTIIFDALKGQLLTQQRSLDERMLELDGTNNKSKLGANAILAVSMAVSRARAKAEGSPLWRSLAEQFGVKDPFTLPIPLMVLIEGGAHSDAGLAFQEFMIVPTDFEAFSEALRAGAETFATLKKLLRDQGHVTSVGDEGAYAPHLKTTQEALDFLMEAISTAGYEGKIQLALDAAASEFFTQGQYTVDGKTFSGQELIHYYQELFSKYPIISLEDSHAEEEWDNFTEMKKRCGATVQLVGDDLLVTNTARIKTAIARDAVNAVLIKPNQIGTVSETVDAIELTRQQGWRPIVSHRGGDTEDTFIAHLAVGLKTGQIKTGSLSRTDRVAKYNELLRIEEALGEKAQLAVLQNN